MSSIAIEMNGVSKTFGPVKALSDVSMKIAKGTIHGLVGQNGAGKSTVIKILAGMYKRDEGDIIVEGQRLAAITPKLIEEVGVHFIHQDRLLVNTATVAEAIFLRNEPRFGPFINHRKMNADAGLLLKQYFDLNLEPSTLISDLSTAQQKIVQITRSLAQKAKILVLDEPTAALVTKEVDSLFKVLRRLKNDGITIIFISHYMSEIMEICDSVTILRNGENVGEVTPKEVGIEKIVEMMTNRDTSEMYPPRDVTLGQSVLEVENLSLKDHYHDISFNVHAGEVVAIAGLLGSGDKELLQTLFGLQSPDSGEIRLDGQKQHFSSPVNAVEKGIAMLPEDRRAHGVAVSLPLSENISLASVSNFSANGLVNRAAELNAVNQLISELDIKTPSSQTPVRDLSGGNQQKVVVAKWLSRDSRVYLLDEPTVAVDVGSKVEIYNLINRLAGEGKSIVFVSSDFEEVTQMCDRVLVIYKGEMIAEYRKGEINAEELLAAASGQLTNSERSHA
ncbi:putative Monosaccharide-transporting ATPase [Vibrio nigripulchritudo SOn1]|uniref:Monosaccharide-transporting ATPase n=1 Tax=Vibrio nigripulchritudo SOn1 TaxID=1238450 RepID=A0AAV2VP40_9VIBR|nr:sugar ABC transporter ATP-binding protein [Vibrio nigripulchritudo]CCO46467.1 putative Monosaccharide-transporting ATPase [Vibrio nigripulchritudo SOn1]